MLSSHARSLVLPPSVRVPPRAGDRPAPPTTASSLGIWTRLREPGKVVHVAGELGDLFPMGKRDTRADRLSKWLGADIPAETRDAVIAEVTKSSDDGRDDFMSRWLLSNDRVDSYNSTLAWDGWKLGDFKRNPVVLLAHDSYVERSLPIGEDVGAFMDPVRKALIGLTRYVSQELAGKETLEARAVRWIKSRFLRAVSVGFEPLKWEVNEERDDPTSWFVAVDFLAQALREYSPTPVPANPDSLADGRAFSGMDPDEIERYAEDVERMLDGAQWLNVPRATLEQMRTALRGVRVQVEIGGTAFVVARGDDPFLATRDENSIDDDSDAEDRQKCPACGYEGPESQFAVADMSGSETGTSLAAPTANEIALASSLPERALREELHRRHAARASNGRLDTPQEPVNAAQEVARAAAIAGQVIDAMDAQAHGRLP